MKLRQLFTPKPTTIVVHAHASKIINGHLSLSGRIYSNARSANYRLVTRKFREAGFMFEAPVTLKKLPLSEWKGRGINYWRKYGCKAFEFECQTDIPWNELPSSTYSIEMEVDGIKPSREPFSEKIRIRAAEPEAHVTEPVGDNTSTLHLFTDDTSRMLRIESFHWGAAELDALKAYRRKPRATYDPVPCIIGEYANTAKDNGKWLFEYLRETDHGIDPTYVIERENPSGYSADQPNAVAYGSVEHLKKCIDAPIVAFSHSLSYIYPNIIKLIAPTEYAAVKKFWLQHGVTALKRSVVRVYRKSVANMDFVAVSSPLEQQVIVDNFGYTPEETVIVGFARYDTLFQLAQSASREERVLLFPTWRTNMDTLSDADFSETEFFGEWTNAMNVLRQKTGMKIAFMVHPMFAHFQHLFELYADEVFLSNDFQSEVVRASCLITDYSSVCFDAIYAGKPVAFFHFDSEEYCFQEGALIDVATQMPGPIAETVEALVDNVATFANDGWSADGTDYQKLYFDHVDDQNTARIAAVIRASVKA